MRASVVEWGIVLGKERRGRTQKIWEKLAYAGRYGGQPLDVLMKMPLRDIGIFCGAVSDIVEEENKPRG